MAKRHELNAPGDWFIDTSCIGHGGSRHFPAAEMRTRLAALIERMALMAE